MELYLSCDAFTFKVTSIFWVIMKKEFINASFRYLENQKELDTKQFRAIEMIDTYISENKFTTVYDFLSMFAEEDLYSIYVHNYINGIILLIEHSDRDGLFSVGNSWDILHMIDKLKPFINDSITLQHLSYLRIVFQKSVDKNALVSIQCNQQY